MTRQEQFESEFYFPRKERKEATMCHCHWEGKRAMCWQVIMRSRRRVIHQLQDTETDRERLVGITIRRVIGRQREKVRRDKLLMALTFSHRDLLYSRLFVSLTTFCVSVLLLPLLTLTLATAAAAAATTTCTTQDSAWTLDTGKHDVLAAARFGLSISPFSAALLAAVLEK